jgi:hypothetical protein
MASRLLLLLLLLGLAGCRILPMQAPDSSLPALPTAYPSPLPASLTPGPSPTPEALPPPGGIGQIDPGLVVPLAPPPLQVALEAGQGPALEATYYPPPGAPAPRLLLVPMPGAGRQAYQGLSARAQAYGWAVLALDLPALSAAPLDAGLLTVQLQAALDWLNSQPGVDSGRGAILGGGLGANLALRLANAAGLRAAVLLSPVADGYGLPLTAPPDPALAPRLLVAAAENDVYANFTNPALDTFYPRLERLSLPGAAHGLNLLIEQPALESRLLDWLIQAVSE